MTIIPEKGLHDVRQSGELPRVSETIWRMGKSERCRAETMLLVQNGLLIQSLRVMLDMSV